MKQLLNTYTVFLPLLVLIMLLGGYSPAQGQQNNEVTITASATVIGDRGINIVIISDMGILEARRLQEGNELYINPVFDAEAGIMRAEGEPGEAIRVSFLEEEEVGRRGGDGSLFFEYEVSGYPSDNQRESELLEEIERELRFNEEGEFYFYVGGRIDMSEAQPGNYDGEFTLEIEYM
ncbi:MAG: hypothetical protein ACQESL_08465 [Bacteroidota bacterium]